jgi:sulfotransferase family protein
VPDPRTAEQLREPQAGTESGAGQRLRVAFVVCPSYHGATLLALLLNNHSRVTALGDTLPHRGEEHVCACGELVDQCSFWQAMSRGLDTSRFAGLPLMLPVLPWPLTRRQMEGSALNLSRSSRLNRAAGRVAGKVVDLGAAVAWRSRPETVEHFAGLYESFYRSALDAHGTSLFVDGSKSWRRAAVLTRALQPGADVKIVHLVRDPRGFALSRRSHGGAPVPESGWLWSDLHGRMESLRTLAPYFLLRYESLCSDPEAELQRLFDFLQISSERVVTAPKYPEKHHLIGNNMLRTFDGEVKLDTRWRTELTAAEQRTVLDCAGEFARRMGYASA